MRFILTTTLLIGVMLGCGWLLGPKLPAPPLPVRLAPVR